MQCLSWILMSSFTNLLLGFLLAVVPKKVCPELLLLDFPRQPGPFCSPMKIRVRWRGLPVPYQCSASHSRAVTVSLWGPRDEGSSRLACGSSAVLSFPVLFLSPLIASTELEEGWGWMQALGSCAVRHQSTRRQAICILITPSLCICLILSIFCIFRILLTADVVDYQVNN